MSDTFRRDHVAAYGVAAPWTRPGHPSEPFIYTPGLDRLAAESAVFDRFYCASYPTIPCRYDLFAGRFGFPTRGWQPLEPDDPAALPGPRENGWCATPSASTAGPAAMEAASRSRSRRTSGRRSVRRGS